MREIKLRAWDKEEMKMYKWKHILEDGWGLENTFKDKDVILMQYTGLKDKNGKEICEGDIVGLSDRCVGFIEWSNKKSCFEVVNKKQHWTNRLDVEPLKVIGNIYENKDLLGGVN